MKHILAILGMLISTQVFSQHVEKYWDYEIDPSTVYYEKVDTTTNITIEEGVFVDSLKHGEWVRYWADGSVQKRLHFSLGLKDGTWKFYDERGRLVLKQRFKDNRLVMAEERRYY